MRSVLYGLLVDSDIDLHQDRPAPDEGDETGRPRRPRITIRRGPPPAVQSPLSGRPVARLALADRDLYTAVQVESGYLLRFHGTCDVEIDAGLRRVTVRAVQHVDEDTVGVLVAGTVLSFLLTMRGEAVLHASAVDVDGAAVAFVGRSGMGKSTTATLLCAAGGRLITDDVLRLELASARPRCHLGATSLRLRKCADDLAALFAADPARRVTGDGRIALGMTPSRRELCPLEVIVIPAPRHGTTSRGLELVRLDERRAALALLQFPRIIGWEDPGVLDRQLQEAVTIAQAVPVYVASLPWGPPFSPSLAPELAAALGLRVRERSAVETVRPA